MTERTGDASMAVVGSTAQTVSFFLSQTKHSSPTTSHFSDFICLTDFSPQQHFQQPWHVSVTTAVAAAPVVVELAASLPSALVAFAPCLCALCARVVQSAGAAAPAPGVVPAPGAAATVVPVAARGPGAALALVAAAAGKRLATSMSASVDSGPWRTDDDNHNDHAVRCPWTTYTSIIGMYVAFVCVLGVCEYARAVHVPPISLFDHRSCFFYA